ncbi:MAG: translation initiation factor 2 [Clostridiales bacterium]|nr:translation initiation factor 2 [Clostridiales bacterium]
MKGSFRIIVENKNVKYDFVINRNITIIQGNSATGKTTLVDMINEYNIYGESSLINIRCDRKCVALDQRFWEHVIQEYDNCIIFIDEDNGFVFSTKFVRLVQETTNYYVIVTRDPISSLPYSTKEIYGIRESKKYGGLKPVYNELYNMYSDYGVLSEKPDIIITEDPNSGYDFFKAVCDRCQMQCFSAKGKSNVVSLAKKLLKENKNYIILIIADGAAFGCEMNKLINIVKDYNVFLYIPESFEWLILYSGLISNVSDILASPEKYIESTEYFSWERFFTSLLVEKTNDTYLHYRKKYLNPVYLDDKQKNKILDVVEWYKICNQAEDTVNDEI